MGRELKRVSLDFDWPMNRVWTGYINPYPHGFSCKACDGEGYNPRTKQISDWFYDFEGTGNKWADRITQDEVQALVDAGRLMDFTHTWNKKDGWQRREDNYIPTAGEVNRAQRGPGSLMASHDAINRSILIEARAKRLGVWGKCTICKGKGEIPYPDKRIVKLHKQWKDFDPPKGKGYQLWTTTNEGAPISPVFKNPFDLARWCENNATIFGSDTMSYESWLEMFTGKKDLEVGSMMVAHDGYVGPLAKDPEFNKQT